MEEEYEFCNNCGAIRSIGHKCYTIPTNPIFIMKQEQEKMTNKKEAGKREKL